MEEATTINLYDQSNKENIPPFSAKQENPVLASKRSEFRRKRVRRPLEDITYFYQSYIQLALAQDSDSFLSVSVPSCASNSKKRKASEEDQENVAVPKSKSLRFGFR
ncbi:hypothetical protein JCGZ_12236 [Jatropha curcas]|uniref:Uncharacterized protein n=1 Tax=Jatropha curcas TaxID=180498 RepID=A0A067KHQ2_JATCU|nr:hypothetical protein JCGZ_12236 [Jatropha curcas]